MSKKMYIAIPIISLILLVIDFIEIIIFGNFGIFFSNKRQIKFVLLAISTISIAIAGIIKKNDLFAMLCNFSILFVLLDIFYKPLIILLDRIFF